MLVKEAKSILTDVNQEINAAMAKLKLLEDALATIEDVKRDEDGVENIEGGDTKTLAEVFPPSVSQASTPSNQPQPIMAPPAPLMIPTSSVMAGLPSPVPQGGTAGYMPQQTFNGTNMGLPMVPLGYVVQPGNQQHFQQQFEPRNNKRRNFNNKQQHGTTMVYAVTNGQMMASGQGAQLGPAGQGAQLVPGAQGQYQPGHYQPGQYY